MPLEIERKFLVIGDAWRSLGKGMLYRQGYLASEPNRTVRVRIAGEQAFLTIKGASEGISRSEYEYPIPLDHATEMLDRMCDRPLIEKTRHKISYGGWLWEVDEFWGDNEGLIMAEVELPDVQQEVTLPEWIGEEVSHDPRYYNSSLVKNPYRNWK
jgi:adenylate cyclase